MSDIKLTQFSHGGGCGCKISPAILTELLAKVPAGCLPEELLVGTATADDAAVYKLNEEQAVIATTDFFTPIVDDPYDFGRIAAANALSDVYAMGGTPIMALAIVGMPLEKLPKETIGRILEGGASICKEANIPIAGGHSIDILEPVYGLVAIGVVNPKSLRTNSQAKEGDVLLLTKPLGIGMLSAALKKGKLDEAGYAEMLKWTTMLNKLGALLSPIEGVHAMTDVTGFGLGGHLLELCRAAKLCGEISLSKLPIISQAEEIAQQGIATGASARNWQSYGESILLPENIEMWQQNLLTDPQTSGGLMVSCSKESLPQVQEIISTSQGEIGVVIGEMKPTDLEGKIKVIA